MNGKLKRILIQGSIWSGFFFLILGCAYSPERKHPLYPTYVQNIHKVVLLTPEIGVFQQMDNGSLLRRDDFSQATCIQIQQIVTQSLPARGIQVHAAGGELMRNPDTKSLQALFRAVDHSIQLHTQGPQFFPSKIDSFEYELGPVAELLNESTADTLMLMLGRQIVAQNKTVTWISIAVIEPQGRLIWYNRGTAQSDLDISSAQASRKLVHQLLNDFPGDAS